MQNITPRKLPMKIKRKKQNNVSSAASVVDRAPLLDDVVVYNLDEDSKYLYNMIMNQPEDDTILIEFDADALGYAGKVILAAKDVMELFKNEMLNVPILHILCL
jgi:hypothetical protein